MNSYAIKHVYDTPEGETRTDYKVTDQHIDQHAIRHATDQVKELKKAGNKMRLSIVSCDQTDQTYERSADTEWTWAETD